MGDREPLHPVTSELAAKVLLLTKFDPIILPELGNADEKAATMIPLDLSKYAVMVTTEDKPRKMIYHGWGSNDASADEKAKLELDVLGADKIKELYYIGGSKDASGDEKGKLEFGLLPLGADEDKDHNLKRFAEVPVESQPGWSKYGAAASEDLPAQNKTGGSFVRSGIEEFVPLMSFSGLSGSMVLAYVFTDHRRVVLGYVMAGGAVLGLVASNSPDVSTFQALTVLGFSGAWTGAYTLHDIRRIGIKADRQLGIGQFYPASIVAGALGGMAVAYAAFPQITGLGLAGSLMASAALSSFASGCFWGGLRTASNKLVNVEEGGDAAVCLVDRQGVAAGAPSAAVGVSAIGVLDREGIAADVHAVAVGAAAGAPAIDLVNREGVVAGVSAVEEAVTKLGAEVTK